MNRKLKISLIVTGVFITPVLLSSLPKFRAPVSTVVLARDSSLLGARIADDGQWRFPAAGKVPAKFEKSLLEFEDRWFYVHPGINPVSIFRAFRNNMKAGEVVAGGSTITMQVARLSRGNPPRTYIEKFIEMLSAFKLELFRSKKKILELYTSNAPFGGNTVGLEAAAWRYTGKSSADLTWAEAAALAILPNSPSLVFPGRNQELLKSRRDMLLRKLCKKKIIDSITMILAIEEPVPGEPKPLPVLAPHLTDYFYLNSKGQQITTTIDPAIQVRAIEILNNHQKELEENHIYNSACIIISVRTGDVLAYVGNSTLDDAGAHEGNVDIIRASRSTGSILKPILYAGMQSAGDILPEALVADIPTRFSGFSPKNFDKGYSGAVSAGTALSQSLNIPAVKMLQKYNSSKFLDLLHKTGFTSFTRSADHYGLSLILGGGETSLWELSGVYASLSRILNRYEAEKKYYKEDYHDPVLVQSEIHEETLIADQEPPLSASSIWLTYEALQRVNRPENESGWQYFASSADLAWKTGTSFGFRDAWAIGTTPGYVIGVWAGNATGEGRPGLTGITAAAPVLFDLAGLLPSGPWFSQPYEDMTTVKVCSRSGFRAGPDCPETKEIFCSVNGLRSEACPFHKMVHLNSARTFQINSDCETPGNILNESWFVLPPAMEYYYRHKHPEYQILPPVRQGCNTDRSIPAMEFIYPVPGVKVFIPRDNTGSLTRIIAEVAHRNPSRKIYWHLDETFIGTTRYIHQMEILAQPGSHVLTVVDEDGNIMTCGFSVVRGRGMD